MLRDIFYSSGSLASKIDVLNSLVTASVILRAVFWSMIAEIPPSPLDLVVSSDCRRVYTSSEHRMLSRESSGLTDGISVRLMGICSVLK